MTSIRSSGLPHLAGLSGLTNLRLNRMDLPCSRCSLWLHAVAFVAALHVLCLKLFYRYALDSCLEIEPKSAMFGGQAPGVCTENLVRIELVMESRHAWGVAPEIPIRPDSQDETESAHNRV